ncbi:taurine transport system substrate-binding domain protein [Acinetobacter baumannii 21072]|uniref:Taurine transport system substrate-binding domain protein n=1 Tax=Acinetobacter baumannii 21072 TaxID=1310697 RepID=A0A062IAB4_ACIBA|nr:taurine transport system substrate-binding domain protein [Acinetobacter baumannii 21072]
MATFIGLIMNSKCQQTLSGNIYLDHAQQKQTLDGEFAQNIF